MHGPHLGWKSRRRRRMKDLIGSEGDLLVSYASSPKIVDEVVKNGLGGMGSLDGWAGGDRDFGYLPFFYLPFPYFILFFLGEFSRYRNAANAVFRSADGMFRRSSGTIEARPVRSICKRKEGGKHPLTHMRRI